ncbi:MAG: L,D-transpeptidase [Chloroflexota bacterium]
MDLRSTAIDLGLIQSSDSFIMPDVVPNERWIRVDLGNQQVIAYQGESPLRAFVVSTGLPIYQTVTGEFRIRMKVSEQTMSGADFFLPGVKWVQYFYSEYAFHSTYWHSDFGVPKSHGCINMTNADAKWLFDWAGPTWDQETVWYKSTDDNPGTLVIVHK